MFMLEFKRIRLKAGLITTPDIPDTSLCLSVQHTPWFHLPRLHYQPHYIVVVQSMEPIHITAHKKYTHLCNQSMEPIHITAHKKYTHLCNQSMEPIHITAHKKYTQLCNQSFNRQYKDFTYNTIAGRTKYYLFSLAARLFQMRPVDVTVSTCC